MTNRTSPDFSHWMDVMKGLAIFEIVMFHFFGDHGAGLAARQAAVGDGGSGLLSSIQNIFIQATRVGSQGIHVFFFMSGVGLAASGLRNQLPARSFLWKRLSRIYPAFMLAILLVVVLQVLTGQSEAWNHYWSGVLASILLVRNYSFDWIRVINGNWWFVCALIPMYCFYLLLRGRMVGRPLFWCLLMFGLSLCYKVVLALLLIEGVIAFDAGQLNPYTAFFLNYSWEFFGGVAFLIVGGWDWLSAQATIRITALLILGLAFQMVGIALGRYEIGRIFNDDFFAVSQILLLSSLYILVSRQNFSRILRLTAWIGAGSYGLYLVHHPISRTLVYYGWEPTSFAVILGAFFLYFTLCLFVGQNIDRAASYFSAR